MGVSTSKEEKESGTAVTAVDYKVNMPSFARAEQLPRGWFPGNGWMKKPVPPGILDFLTQKKCADLYEDYKAAVSKAAGGSFFGWSSPKILEVTETFKPEFKKKGVDVYYCMGYVWRYNGQSSYQEFYYYIVFATPGPFDGAWTPPELYYVGKEEACSCGGRTKKDGAKK